MLIDSSFIEYFSNDMIFVKAHAEAADSLTAKKYNVSGFPTFVLVDSKGEEIDRIVGYMEAEPFLAQINDYMNGIGTLDDLLSKVKESKDRTLYFEIADKYKYRGAPDDAKIWFEKVIADGKPTDSLSGEATFALADMTLRNKEYESAIDKFAAIEKDFKGTSFAEMAILYSAYIYRAKINDTAKSISEYERFVKMYPASEDAEYATKKISELKGETIESK